jgi:putative tryptophan/tyrosine transport system substrate-binding protein
VGDFASLSARAAHTERWAVLARCIGKRMTSAVASLKTILPILMLTVSLSGAQPAGKVYSVGILGDKAADSNEILAWQTFRDGLRKHGWNEGVNIRIEYRWVEGNVARLPDVAADLVRLNPDLLATRGSLFTGALKAATSSIPIVFVAHADPVGTGHVASLARPGGNITGMALLQTELGPKCLELLHSAVPAATRTPFSGIPALRPPSPGSRPWRRRRGCSG